MRSDPTDRDARSRSVNDYGDKADSQTQQLPCHYNDNANGSNSENCNTSTKTDPDPAPIQHDASSAFPPDERAFSIPHIIELILSLTDNETLLKCRLVSHRWSSVASKQLLDRRLSLAFKEFPKKSTSTSTWTSSTSTSHVTYFVLCQDSSRSLEELSALLKTSTNFPITSFEFRKIDCRRIFHHSEFFFSSYGSFVKKIKIDGPLHFKDLKTLLFLQAPNLEELELTTHSRDGKFNVYYEFPGKHSSLSKKQMQHSTLKLQVLKPGPFLARKYLHEILQVSPNVRVENNLKF